jgi:hypothetical protein
MPEDRVIDVIKKKEVKMRPRSYFVGRTIAIAAASVVLFLLLIYVVSFIIFALHQNGVWFAPDFGLSGWSLFLTALPWGLFTLSLILLILLANLLMRYAFIYHQPLFYFLFAFILVTLLGAFFLAASSFQPGLFQYAAQNIPIVGTFYTNETALPASVHRGLIVSFLPDGGGFVIDNGLGVTSTVVAAQGVVFIENFHVGDTVLVFGTRSATGTISAFGIERIAVSTSTGPVGTSSAVGSI